MNDIVNELAADAGLDDEEKARQIAEDEARAQIQGRLVLTDRTGTQCFVWHEGERGYTGPYASKVVWRVLERDCPTGGNATVPAEKGGGTVLKGPKFGPREYDNLFRVCGDIAEDIVYVAGLERAEYDLERRLLRAGAARWRRGLEPQHDSRIARWLDLLCGGQLDRVLDWLATFRQVHRPTCALYLEGEKGCGKGMLAAGLARLYEADEAVPYAHATDEFNDRLLKSSLVWADEKIPDQGMRRGAPSAVFRTMISGGRFYVNGKGRSVVPMEACIRLLITANNIHALNLVNESLEKDDVDAIAQRVLHVCAADRGAEAAAYLREIGGPDETQQWVDGDGIARHVLWLEQHRQVTAGGRFLVEGGGKDVSRLVVGEETSRVLEAMARYLDRYDDKETRFVNTPRGEVGVIAVVRTPHIQPGGGELKVSTSALLETWPKLIPDDRRPPNLRTLGRMLANLPGAKQGKLVVGGKRVNCWDVPGDLIVSEAEALSAGDPDEIRKLLGAKSDPQASNG